MTLLHEELQRYQDSLLITEEEKTTCQVMLTSLTPTTPSCFSREHFPAHFTGSAWILNESLSACVLVHHKKLNLWIQPGGHADGNSNLMEVARKEALEETGLAQLRSLSNEIFDCDKHLIPSFNGIKEHTHLDVRYLFQSSSLLPLCANHESFDVRWVSLDALHTFTKEPSLLRMAKKSKDLLT